MKKIKIEVPALLFGPKYDSLEFIRREEMISVTNKLGLKKGIVIGNFIVDSSGKTFRTVSAKRKGNYHNFWKFEFFNPLILIELEVEDLGNVVDLSELKRKILHLVTVDRHQWENYGDIKDIIQAIQQAKNHRELISFIGTYIEPLAEK